MVAYRSAIGSRLRSTLLLIVVVVGAVALFAPVVTASDTLASRSSETAVAALENYPGANWLGQNGDLSNSRYSTLSQINTSNVATLQVAWQGQLNSGAFSSVESFPLEFDNILLTTAGGSSVYEVNATTGAPIRTIIGPQTVNRGVAIGDGMLFASAGAGTFGAWNIYTGQQVWKTTFAPPAPAGHVPSIGPNAIFYDHMLFFGTGGNDGSQVEGGGVDGSMNAYNADTGAPIWSWSAVPLKPGDAGSSTWGSPAELGTGGGGDWLIGTIDPQHGMLYFGTGNAEPYYGRTPGKDLYTSSIVALDYKTGTLKWSYQLVHHDMWDYDCVTPPVLWNHMINGKMVPGIEMTCKPGYYYEFNRVTGRTLIPIHETPIPVVSDSSALTESNAYPTEPIPAGQSPVPHCVNPADMPGPAPDGQPFIYSCTFAPFGSNQYVAMTPSPLNDFNVMSYSPQTGYIYACDATGNIALKADPAHGPNAFFGTNGPAPTRYILGGYPFANPHQQLGVVAAINLQNNDIVWQQKWYADKDGACYGGSTATAGGLVFASSQHGYLYAWDAKTGQQLYSSQVCGNQLVASPPMVYAVAGKEYVEQACGGSTTGDINSTVTTDLPRHDETVVLTLPGG